MSAAAAAAVFNEIQRQARQEQANGRRKFYPCPCVEGERRERTVSEPVGPLRSTAAAKTCNFRSKRPKFECFLLKNLSVKVKIFLVVVVVGGERRCQWSAARPFVSLPFAIGRSQQRWEMGTQWGSATATIRLLRDIFNVNNIDSLLHKQEEKNKVIQRRHQRKSQTSDFLFKQPTSNPPKGTHSELWNSFCQRLPLPYLRHNSILQSSFKFCEKSIKDRS